MSEKIALKAEDLGNDTKIMDSYRSFFKGNGFFLTKNGKLYGAKRKPPKFPSNAKELMSKWTNNDWFVTAQRNYLMFMAGIDKTSTIKASHYISLKSAYEKWGINYYVVDYGKDAKWACNLFVGETLHWAGVTQMNGSKYYSAKQIWEGSGGFKAVAKKDLKRGDVAAFGGHHVEIVTKVERNHYISDDDFCSRGAGRTVFFGLLGGDFGTERCGHEIDDEDVKFFRVGS